MNCTGMCSTNPYKLSDNAVIQQARASEDVWLQRLVGIIDKYEEIFSETMEEYVPEEQLELFSPEDDEY